MSLRDERIGRTLDEFKNGKEFAIIGKWSKDLTLYGDKSIMYAIILEPVTCIVAQAFSGCYTTYH